MRRISFFYPIPIPINPIDLPSASAEVTEANGLLWGQIDHNEAIDTGLLAVLEQTLLAIAQHRVVVTHQHEGSLQAPASGGAYKLKDCGDSNTVLEGLGVGLLNSRTISNGVRERDTEFNNIYNAN
jgi:hypothetical protein